MPKEGYGIKASRCYAARIPSQSPVTGSSGVSSPECDCYAFNNLQWISLPWACPWASCRLLAFTVSFGKGLYCSTTYWAQANLLVLGFEPDSLPLVSLDAHQYWKAQGTTYVCFVTPYCTDLNCIVPQLSLVKLVIFTSVPRLLNLLGFKK